MRLSRAVLAVLPLSLAAGAATAIGLASERPAGAGDRPVRPVTSVDPEAAANFHVLRREREADDELTARAQATIAGGPRDDLGANGGLARRALRTADGEELFVVPARGWMCLVSDLGTGACNRIDAALAGYIVSLRRLGTDERFVLRGLAPDDVSSVTIVGTGREQAQATLASNVWEMVVAFEPITLRLKAADTVREVPLYAPPTAPTALGP